MGLVADRKSRKTHGVHYTPEKLAEFLARRLWINAQSDFCKFRQPISILDPACGDGALLNAIARQISNHPICLTGFETDPVAAQQAEQKLVSFTNCQAQVLNQDFLEHALQDQQSKFDLVISNPPYVRTQVLGQSRSQDLANEFGLKGRVDLYHAFLAAITKQVADSGWIATLTSNRFLYVQSGMSTRKLFLDHYEITELYDLGDTKLFDAAVLPAVLIGKKSSAKSDRTTFVRVQRRDITNPEPQQSKEDLFHCIETAIGKQTKVDSPDNQRYEIESGWLQVDDDRRLWRLSSPERQAWLEQVVTGQQMTINDVAQVKVGIKTTADSVFIRDDWEKLPADQQPEKMLLRPLITHKVASKWKGSQPQSRVLYPYVLHEKRMPIELQSFPGACAYFEAHRERLSNRKYLVQSGRKWFEIWVPHRVMDWQNPKIVWPDISETPKFFLDNNGSIVNGDCYWIKLKPGRDSDLLYLILAVANSSLAVRFYDCCFYNRLYGRSRRFMTQYVKQFPLPNPETRSSRACIEAVKTLLTADLSEHRLLETKIDELVYQAFGLSTAAEASTR